MKTIGFCNPVSCRFDAEIRQFELFGRDETGERLTARFPVEGFDSIIEAAADAQDAGSLTEGELTEITGDIPITGLLLGFAAGVGLTLTVRLRGGQSARFLIPSDSPISELRSAAQDISGAIRRINAAPH